MGKDHKLLGVAATTTGGIPLTAKDYYKLQLGVNKPATAGGVAATTGGIPLTAKDYYKLQLGVNKPATAGGGNGGRLASAGAGLGGTKGAVVGEGGRGWGGASSFSPTDRSTSKRAVKVVNEYCYEEENRRSATDDDADRSTFTKTAVKVRNEYYVEEENRGLFQDGDAEEGEKIQNTQDGDVELLSDEDDGHGAEMGDDHKYNEDVRVGGVDARPGSGDDFFDGDDCYGDVAGVFEDGYEAYDDDGEDGADFWW